MAPPPPPASANDDEEEDDYLTMTFAEPTPNLKHETLTQRKRRLAREAEERARPKSKAQIAEEERTKRENALATSSLDTGSKGFKMMQALGYKPGTALGVARTKNKTENGNEEGDGKKEADKEEEKDDRLLEPVGLEMREGRSGIGADAEKKRRFREEVEKIQGAEKRRKVDEGDFRERQVRERGEKRQEGQVWGAMKVAERLDEEDDEDHNDEKASNGHLRGGGAGEKRKQDKKLEDVNVFWRGLAKDRMVKERDRRMRYDLHQSLSRLPTYEDPDEEEEDRIAIGRKDRLEEVDLELDQEDPELEDFDSLPVEEKLGKLVAYLRERWHYCFWCKFRYPDAEMEGCPGLTEDDHD